tara:strand:+ start:2255 stop:3100 length:846 start_codon:yes stop_codon:yes gene_type:complete
MILSIKKAMYIFLILSSNTYLKAYKLNIKVKKNYIKDTMFKQYLPRNSTPAKNIAFYSGGNSIIPSDIYSGFLKQLANQGFSVYAMSNNNEANSLLYDSLYGSDIYILSHSSGCVTAINDANNMREINSAIFMDPVNNQRLINRFNFMDNSKLSIKYLKNILIINAEKSYKWSIFPEFNIPFIPGFRLTEKELTSMNDVLDISCESAEEYGHSDILDSIWSDFMHNTISKGLDDRSDEQLEKYHVWLAKTISEYINNDNSNMITISSSNHDDNDNDNDIEI